MARENGYYWVKEKYGNDNEWSIAKWWGGRWVGGEFTWDDDEYTKIDEHRIINPNTESNCNKPAVSNNANCKKEYERGIEDGKTIAEHGTTTWAD